MLKKKYILLDYTVSILGRGKGHTDIKYGFLSEGASENKRPHMLNCTNMQALFV